MLKLTELRIAPKTSWNPVGPSNPLRAVVKLDNEGSTIECVLSDAAARKMLDLCAEEIASEAQRNVREFVAAVTAIEADKAAVLIGAA